MEIKECKVESKVFRKGRWDAVLDKKFDGTRRMPYAHYVWLSANPAFEIIPKGYVIHHLDWDPTNDDISNLALMQKHHHVSHHWKNRKIRSEINVKAAKSEYSGFVFCPSSEPVISFNANRGRYCVKFTEGHGQSRHRRYVSVVDGKPMINREDAEKFRDRLLQEMRATVETE